jgi:glycosyltransferase involved in cell wall biosynthesis
MPGNHYLPVIGVFTKQLDNWQSGSGHHLNEIMHRILDMNEAHPRFKFVFIHYAKSGNPIYQRVEELIIPRNPLAAAWILRKRRFDILHYTPLTIFAPIWGVRAKKVATIHGAEQLIVPQFYGSIEMLHERFLVPLYARRMDHIITVSHTSRGFFMGRYRISGDRITVCPNAVSPLYRVLQRRLPPNAPKPGEVPIAAVATMDRRNADEATHSEQSAIHNARAVLSRFGLSAGEPFLFHLSRFSERKNPWTILEGFRRFLHLPAPSPPNSTGITAPAAALASAPEAAPDAVAPRTPVPYTASSGVDEPVKASASLISPSLVSADFAGVPPSAFKLVIGGTRWDNPEVTQYLERAGISDRVIRTGFLKEQEAVAFYNYAAAFLFPSLAEGFGMPNLEAMACGCPVITSNVFAIPEVVGDAAIVLKNPLDPDALALAIRRVVYEPPLRKRLIDRGLARVRQFDWDESARKVMEVYERLAGQQ